MRPQNSIFMKLYLFTLLAVIAVASLRAEVGDIIRVGQEAPAFSGTNTDGAEVALESMRGKVVVVVFFSTWFAPAIEAMPYIEKEIWKPHQSADLVVLGIGREQKAPELIKFKKAKRLTFALVPDPQKEIYNKYASQYILRSYVIGKDGVVRYTFAGFDGEEFDKMKDVIERELKK